MPVNKIRTGWTATRFMSIVLRPRARNRLLSSSLDVAPIPLFASLHAVSSVAWRRPPLRHQCTIGSGPSPWATLSRKNFSRA